MTWFVGRLPTKTLDVAISHTGGPIIVISVGGLLYVTTIYMFLQAPEIMRLELLRMVNIVFQERLSI